MISDLDLICLSFQLKLPTRPPREGSFTYLQSRMGGLVRASDETEEQVMRVNEAFNRLHGHGFKLKMGANMLERTVRGNTLKRGGSNMEQYGATLPHFLLVLL